MSLIRLRTFVEVYRQCSISGQLAHSAYGVAEHCRGVGEAREENGVTPTSAAVAE
ncbi:hypothetical protein [Pectobacterium sp. A5351]|uniref:hypothetical protein n=1 Tax=Pectobacterium sp. A5351 TaxID=2914983 RepID=UPI0023304A33|nr:hypothetical protein [Pectobacterium sp. A5351]WCG83887.1 hypothetical protein O1Q74_04090 [Pectobacterium sp. A5351]